MVLAARPRSTASQDRYSSCRVRQSAPVTTRRATESGATSSSTPRALATAGLVTCRATVVITEGEGGIGADRAATPSVATAAT